MSSDSTATTTNEPAWLDARLMSAAAPGAIGSTVQLAGSWCESCGRAEFPQRSSCPQCLRESAFRPLSSTGIVVGHTAVLHQPPGSVLQAPYGVVAVEHAEEITVLGPLVGTEWERVAIGDVVTTVTIQVGDRLGFGYQLE